MYSEVEWNSNTVQSEIHLEGLGKIMETLVQIASNPAEIWTKYL